MTKESRNTRIARRLGLRAYRGAVLNGGGTLLDKCICAFPHLNIFGVYHPSEYEEMDLVSILSSEGEYDGNKVSISVRDKKWNITKLSGTYLPNALKVAIERNKIKS